MASNHQQPTHYQSIPNLLDIKSNSLSSTPNYCIHKSVHLAWVRMWKNYLKWQTWTWTWHPFPRRQGLLQWLEQWRELLPYLYFIEQISKLIDDLKKLWNLQQIYNSLKVCAQESNRLGSPQFYLFPQLPFELRTKYWMRQLRRTSNLDAL